MAAITPDATLADIVTDHPDLARELERRGLDYCCGGRRTLADACTDNGADPAAVAAELNDATSAPPAEWAAFDAAALTDHVEATHHAYLHDELPRLAALADKVCGVHGDRHPELADVQRTLGALAAELEPHLTKEERVLFPMIRELAAADAAIEFHCGSLRNPISVMLGEHDAHGERLAELRRLTSDYQPPADACASYEALYRGLATLEADTHQHVHKENNRLFPMVVELEQQLAGA